MKIKYFHKCIVFQNFIRIQLSSIWFESIKTFWAQKIIQEKLTKFTKILNYIKSSCIKKVSKHFEPKKLEKFTKSFELYRIFICPKIYHNTRFIRTMYQNHKKNILHQFQKDYHLNNLSFANSCSQFVYNFVSTMV